MATEPITISVLSFGAKGDNKTDDTKAIQAAIDQGFKIGAIVVFPNGSYRVSQLVLRAGSVLQGVSSGTYPDNATIAGSSVLVRIGNTNKHILLAPDGANFCRIRDLAIDGNKNNNTKGYGLCVADAAAGHGHDHRSPLLHSHQPRIERLPRAEPAREHRPEQRAQLLAHGRRHHGGRVGQHDRGQHHRHQRASPASAHSGPPPRRAWDASSPNYSANIAHVTNNDIYGNLVGIAVANGSSGCMIAGNGVDRSKKQGITVYSGASNALVTNSLHSNGTSKNNGYAHIDVGSGVGEVCISDNNFTPQDSDVSNKASYCVYIAPGATRVIGDIGCTDPTAAVARTNAQAGAVPGTALSLVGAVVQGDGSDIFVLKNKAGKVVWRVTDGGTVKTSAIEGMPVAGVEGATADARFVGSTKSGAPTSGNTWIARRSSRPTRPARSGSTTEPSG